jgi:hypothetical protein
VKVVTDRIAGAEFSPSIRLFRQCVFDNPCPAVSDRIVLL